MKMTLLGSLGHINQFVIPRLIADGNEVTVITTNPDRQEAIRTLGAQPAVGTMTDAAFLTQQFTGRDVVYLMFSSHGNPAAVTNMTASAQQQADIYKQAIQQSGVKHVVDLSSVGANLGPEVGGLYIYNIIERTLKQLDDVQYTFVRPVGFYTNLFAYIPGIKAHHEIATNLSGTMKNAWVAPSDIAEVVYQALSSATAQTENQVHYAASDAFTGNELVAALRTALDMPDLKWHELTDAEQLAHDKAIGFSKEWAEAATKMNSVRRTEDFYADFRNHIQDWGQVKLTDFLPDFVAQYQKQE
ncbi:hypothetical protein IV38_GL001042 [Lactobacillus selangorensis]|uniref:NAD(P)-binding domain-containing protein n=1 Tax=Lactobacillus selangorensis TaxID=81857 RepID=A0A0R2FWL4_9LACO|nr:NAD(P)H-binding protein [Lactobacillus selangorensis]KRN28835.1 hypothetical protein IV38_GL001042 [Lactobacillus selangorensis]KRN32755.1 hypothetical protein IV40_GL000811 [Lactobacillus selangorensis]